MLTLDLGELTVEFKEGAIKHVGASNSSGTAKLYDVEEIDVREFGDTRVKLAFADAEDNEVEVALSPEGAREVLRGLATLEEESRVFE